MLLILKKPLSVFVFIFLTLYLLFAAYQTRAFASPSFPCKGGLSNNERLICAKTELGELDRHIAKDKALRKQVLFSAILEHINPRREDCETDPDQHHQRAASTDEICKFVIARSHHEQVGLIAKW